VFVLVGPKEPFMDAQEAAGAKVLVSKRLGELGPYDLLTIMHFKKIIDYVKPDVILAHEGRSAALMRRAAGKSVPVVDVNHGRSARQSRATYATIVINTVQLRNSRNILASEHMVYNLPNSINLANHTPPQLPKNWNEPPVIGTMSRLVKDKGLDVFIDALNLLNRRGTKFKVLIAGEGEERPTLERKIFEFRLGEFVKLTGWCENTDEFFQNIDIFCFPSRKEEFGLVLLEAWKHGLPAVVSDTDGPSDIVTNGIDAIIARKENPAELANALSDLLKNKAKADRLAANGYKKLKDRYDIPNLANQLQEILEEVVGKRPVKIRSKARKAA
jgi:glycosyltransferase involved in cell wall biosynthesis